MRRSTTLSAVALLAVALLAAPRAVGAEVALPSVHEELDPFLTTPAAGHLWEMPVLVLCYIPTADGVHVDPAITGWGSAEAPVPLADLRRRIMALTVRTKFALEEGSRFRAYSDPTAKPSLGYRIVDMVTVFEPVPPGKERPWGDPGCHFPDYNQILTRADIAHFVEDLGVKEVWLWMYHTAEREPVESNMSSPVTGDISNSSRFADDLPVLSKTYIVYSYNFTRDARCALENHMHQIESQLSHVNTLRDGNNDLFDRDFVGTGSRKILGRCGWSHCPPNTLADYDVASETEVESDIEDWTPDGSGHKKRINCRAWLDKTYAWPDGKSRFDEWEGTYWFIYWMQSHPGRGNRIRYGDRWMTNWWALVGDWDGSIQSGFGLHGAEADQG